MQLELSAGNKIRLVLKTEGQPDQIVEFPKPKFGAVLDFEAASMEAQEKGGKGGATLVGDFLVACGLPREVLRELESEQVELIVSNLTSKKK